jgi:hypothetical protein
MNKKETALLYATAWEKLDFSIFFNHLSDKCHYSSQYVFEELDSKQKIIDYLTGKVEAVKKSSGTVVARLAKLTGSATLSNMPGDYCVAMYQEGDEAISAIVLFEAKNNLIERFDLCMPELYPIELIVE